MNLSFKNIQNKKSGEQSRRLNTLLGLDFATSGVKAVRLNKVKDQIFLTGVDLLDPININAGECPKLPKSLSAYYAALCGSIPDAQLRVFAHTWKGSEGFAAVVKENLSASDHYRTAGRVLIEGTAKRAGSVLGVAIPESTVAQYLDVFASGAPAPHSLELSGLAAFSAFLFTRGKQTADQTICLIETGQRYTYVAFFYKNVLQVINRFDIGGEILMRKVQTVLGVDKDMAKTILSGGSVDVSAPVRQALAPFIKQLDVYREYVERQNKSVLSGVYLSGGEATSSYWQSAIEGVLGLVPQVWSPFEKLEVASDTIPEHLKGQESRFAAAVGAALAGMENI